jgi:hypothetical protein
VHIIAYGSPSNQATGLKVAETVLLETIVHTLHSALQYHADLQREHADNPVLCSGAGVDMHVSQRFPLHTGRSDVQRGPTVVMMAPARMSFVATALCRAARCLSSSNFHNLFLSDCNIMLFEQKLLRMRGRGGKWPLHVWFGLLNATATWATNARQRYSKTTLNV